jgi:hypothetical protein
MTTRSTGTNIEHTLSNYLENSNLSLSEATIRMCSVVNYPIGRSMWQATLRVVRKVLTPSWGLSVLVSALALGHTSLTITHDVGQNPSFSSNSHLRIQRPHTMASPHPQSQPTQTRRRVKIHVSGFGPFNGVADNPTGMRRGYFIWGFALFVGVQLALTYFCCVSVCGVVVYRYDDE